jgi:hypothetical protein
VFCEISAALKYTVAAFTLAVVKIGFCAKAKAVTNKKADNIVFLNISRFLFFI